MEVQSTTVTQSEIRKERELSDFVSTGMVTMILIVLIGVIMLIVLWVSTRKQNDDIQDEISNIDNLEQPAPGQTSPSSIPTSY